MDYRRKVFNALMGGEDEETKLDIRSHVTNLHRYGEYAEVEVKVRNIRAIPEPAARFRARVRALWVSGIIDSTIETAGDITAGQVSRMTKVTKERDVNEGRYTRDRVYTIEVKGDPDESRVR